MGLIEKEQMREKMALLKANYFRNNYNFMMWADFSLVSLNELPEWMEAAPAVYNPPWKGPVFKSHPDYLYGQFQKTNNMERYTNNIIYFSIISNLDALVESVFSYTFSLSGDPGINAFLHTNYDQEKYTTKTQRNKVRKGFSDILFRYDYLLSSKYNYLDMQVVEEEAKDWLNKFHETEAYEYKKIDHINLKKDLWVFNGDYRKTRNAIIHSNLEGKLDSPLIQKKKIVDAFYRSERIGTCILIVVANKSEHLKTGYNEN